MDRRGGTNSKRVLSWIAAVILIAAGAIAIGWFAGAALIDFWAPASADYPVDEEGSESLPDGTDPGATADGEAAVDLDGLDDAEPASQSAEGSGADAGTTDTNTSPFASPPWANNLTIKPLDEQVGEEAEEPIELIVEIDEEALPAEPVESAVLQQIEQSEPAPPAETAAEQQGESLLYKVRVGPYPTKEEAAAAAVRLSELQYPTIVISSGPFYVQIGAFTVWANAENLLKKVQASGFTAAIVI